MILTITGSLLCSVVGSFGLAQWFERTWINYSMVAGSIIGLFLILWSVTAHGA